MMQPRKIAVSAAQTVRPCFKVAVTPPSVLPLVRAPRKSCPERPRVETQARSPESLGRHIPEAVHSNRTSLMAGLCQLLLCEPGLRNKAILGLCIKHNASCRLQRGSLLVLQPEIKTFSRVSCLCNDPLISASDWLLSCV